MPGKHTVLNIYTFIVLTGEDTGLQRHVLCQSCFQNLCMGGVQGGDLAWGVWDCQGTCLKAVLAKKKAHHVNLACI